MARRFNEALRNGTVKFSTLGELMERRARELAEMQAAGADEPLVIEKHDA
jgi:hypothetical protein